MEERAWWTGAAVLALTLAFSLVSALVWVTRGRSYPLLKAKLRLGGLLLATTAVATGCFDKGDSAMVMCYDAGWDSQDRDPDIDVGVDSIDYGSIAVGQSGVEMVPILNQGSRALSIASITVADEAAVFTVSEAGPVSLQPGEQLELEITFTPTEPSAYQATLTISSDDPDEPTLQITLEGEGLVP